MDRKVTPDTSFGEISDADLIAVLDAVGFQRPMGNRRGWSSLMTYWLNVKPVGPISATRVDRR